MGECWSPAPVSAQNTCTSLTMPLPRVSLRSFLSSAKSALHNASQQTSPLTFVIGNEAADLDSLCSAVVLAYLRTYTSTSPANTLYIPLSSIPHTDLSLRLTKPLPTIPPSSRKDKMDTRRPQRAARRAGQNLQRASDGLHRSSR